MKTDDLIALLAADTTAVPRGAVPRQLGLASAAGIALAAGAMLVTIGVRPDLARAVETPVFWMKVLFPAAIACAGLATLTRLARPGVRARKAASAIAAPIVVLWLIAIAAYASAPLPERAAMVWGQSWRLCTVSVVTISAPIFAASFLALRRLAPTRLVQAGSCAGLLSGAAGAAVYALHCPETAMPFMAIWYVAGIAITSALGAALGPRLLRW